MVQMKIYYGRVSSIGQNPDRQLVNSKGFDYVWVDTCSGSIPLYERPKGSEIKKMLDKKVLTELHIHSIDRLGRNTLDVLAVWEELTKNGVKIVCRNPNIVNITEDGRIDKFSELMMSILSTMSTFERNLIRERQLEGIRIRKEKGLYGGRKVGTADTVDRLLSKEKNKKIIEYLKKGSYSYAEIGKIVGCSTTTITKVNKAYNSKMALA